jgi:hypothetical protein
MGASLWFVAAAGGMVSQNGGSVKLYMSDEKVYMTIKE